MTLFLVGVTVVNYILSFIFSVDDYTGPIGTDERNGGFAFPHLSLTSPVKAGVSATVTGVSVGNSGSETRPKNMNVIYIIRVV